MQFNCSAISDSTILLLNSLPIHSVNHKHKQKECRCMSDNLCLCNMCGFIVIMSHLPGIYPASPV